MVKLKLPRFGGVTVEIESESVIDFPAGLGGFESCHKFKLFHQEGKPNVLWLQSLDKPEAVFSLRDPALLNISYAVSLSDADEKLLETAPGDDIVVAVIMYKDEKTENNISAVKANMFAPIILNVTKRRGIQKILKELDTQLVISGG
jgi:flagellar assembly factor FliW